MHQVDVVVLPTKYNKGVSRSLLEAMACGKPIIATDLRGCSSTVDHGRNGYLIDVDDYDKLKHYITKLINTPHPQFQAMSRASRQKAEEQFDEDYVLQAYTEEICEGASAFV